MRKSERRIQKKRPFSPSECTAVAPKKSKLDDAEGKSHPARKPDRRQFECFICGSNSIINPKKKKKKNGVKPTPRYVKRDGDETVMVCNACGLREKRSKKKQKTVEMREPVKWLESERRKYTEECQKFTSILGLQINDSEAQKLYCPNFNTKQCGCVQNYIIGQDSASDDTNPHIRAESLLELMTSSKKLRCVRYREEQDDLNSSEPQKPVKVGLGNGRKKSTAYLDFILEQRDYLRNQLNFCEKACQKILGYSNNLLYKRLKTEDNQSRIRVTKGDRSKLMPIEGLVKIKCCQNRCTAIAKKYPGVLHEWRDRASGQKCESRRVVAEMATPTGESAHNCKLFIRLVTGCSLSTIDRVLQQIDETGGEREPPEHGLKKYWEMKQSQQIVVSELSEQPGENPIQNESETTGNSPAKLDGERNMEEITENTIHSVNRNESTHTDNSLAVNKGKEDETWTILPNLLVKRAFLIQEQKSLMQRQEMLKSKQNLVENDLIKMLQQQGEQRRRNRKKSGHSCSGSGSFSDNQGVQMNKYQPVEVQPGKSTLSCGPDSIVNGVQNTLRTSTQSQAIKCTVDQHVSYTASVQQGVVCSSGQALSCSNQVQAFQCTSGQATMTLTTNQESSRVSQGHVLSTDNIKLVTHIPKNSLPVYNQQTNLVKSGHSSLVSETQNTRLSRQLESTVQSDGERTQVVGSVQSNLLPVSHNNPHGQVYVKLPPLKQGSISEGALWSNVSLSSPYRVQTTNLQGKQVSTSSMTLQAASTSTSEGDSSHLALDAKDTSRVVLCDRYIVPISCNTGSMMTNPVTSDLGNTSHIQVDHSRILTTEGGGSIAGQHTSKTVIPAPSAADRQSYNSVVHSMGQMSEVLSDHVTLASGRTIWNNVGTVQFNEAHHSA